MADIDIKQMESSDAPKPVLEVYKLLKKYREDPDRIWWQEKVYDPCWRAVAENEIWSADEKKQMMDKDQIPICINDMSKGVQGSSAVITASKPGIVILPIGSSDLYVAELLKRALEFVDERADGQQKTYKLVKHCKIGAVSFLDLSYDRTKGRFGKITIKVARATNVYWDKNSEEEDLSDVNIIKARTVSKEYCKETYPGISDDDLRFNLVTTEEDPGKSSGVTGRDNYAIESSKGTRADGQDDDEKKDIWEIEAWLLKKYEEWCITTINPDEPKDLGHQVFESKEEANAAFEMLPPEVSSVSKVWNRMCEKRVQRIIVGKKLISETVNPYGVDADGDPICSIIPLMHEETLRGMPTSPSFFALEVSKERNKRRMQSIYVVTKNIDAPMAVHGDYKWVRDKKYGDIIVVDKNAPFAPTRLLPGTTTGEFLTLEQEAKEDLKNIFDTQDVMVGKLPSAQMSGVSIQALQDLGGMMSRPFTAKVEAVISKKAKLLLAIILRHWPRANWERLIEDDEKRTWQPDKEVQIDDMGQPVPPEPDEITNKWMQALEVVSPMNGGGNPLEIIDLDVKVTAGSTMPTNRFAKRQDAIEMVKGGIYDAEAALEYIDDPYKDQVSARMKKKEQMMMQQEMMKGSNK